MKIYSFTHLQFHCTQAYTHAPFLSFWSNPLIANHPFTPAHRVSCIVSSTPVFMCLIFFLPASPDTSQSVAHAYPAISPKDPKSTGVSAIKQVFGAQTKKRGQHKRAAAILSVQLLFLRLPLARIFHPPPPPPSPSWNRIIDCMLSYNWLCVLYHCTIICTANQRTIFGQIYFPQRSMKDSGVGAVRAYKPSFHNQWFSMKAGIHGLQRMDRFVTFCTNTIRFFKRFCFWRFIF